MTWAIPSTPGYILYYLSDFFDGLSLIAGTIEDDDIDAIVTGQFTARNEVTTNSYDKTITATPTVYAGNVGYEEASGFFSQVWRLEFDNLDWHVTGGTSKNHVFGVQGTAKVDRLWFNAASYGVAGGDDHIRCIDTTASPHMTATAVDPSDWFGKGSDINVQVFAHAQ